MDESKFVAGAVTTETDTVVVTIDEDGYVDVYGPFSYWAAHDLRGQMEVEFDGRIEIKRLGQNYAFSEDEVQ